MGLGTRVYSTFMFSTLCLQSSGAAPWTWPLATHSPWASGRPNCKFATNENCILQIDAASNTVLFDDVQCEVGVFFRVYKKFLNTNLLQNNFWFICKETRSPESGGGGRPPGPIVGGGGSGPLLILPDN
jgi:hypothetical protein